MWPLVLGIGIAALLDNAFAVEKKAPKRRRLKTRDIGTDGKKKIFISFAATDRKYRDFLVSQARDKRSPFSFIDMSVKEPWENRIWKRRCRELIRNCDGMIVLLSKRTWHSSGSRWEINCARDERIPVVGMHIKKDSKGAKPPELYGKRVIEWSWDELEDVVKKF